MFTHDQVWRGIDRLAREHGLSASGLARRSGLDSTTFNPSKRVTKQNKPRWPSTESLAKVLAATETSTEAFVALMADQPLDAAPIAPQRLRCIAMDHTDRGEMFDQSGFPVGEAWDEIDFPNLEDPHGYAIEVRGDDLLPTYRDGDLLIVSPVAGVRRRDRIVLKALSGPILTGELLRRTARRIELAPFGHDRAARVLTVKEVAWLARIVWVSQ